MSAGKWMDKKIAEPPIPGTPEDRLQMQDIQHVFDNGLPIVQKLRSNPDFVEMGVYENYSEESKKHRLTTGPLTGSRGFGLQVSGCHSFQLCFPSPFLLPFFPVWTVKSLLRMRDGARGFSKPRLVLTTTEAGSLAQF